MFYDIEPLFQFKTNMATKVYNFELYKRVTLADIKSSGINLKYATSEQRSDFDFVIEAVKRCGTALQYASDEMKNDPGLFLWQP